MKGSYVTMYFEEIQYCCGHHLLTSFLFFSPVL
jgi:hypothetical protein